MEAYIINGGNKLFGEVNVESAKNSLLPLLVATMLTDEQVVLENCPKITDVLSLINIVNYLGVKTNFYGNDLVVDASGINGYEIPKKLTKELRASVFTLGALISRFKKAKISYPGGCDIGKRPIDIHLKGLESLGVKITNTDGYIECFSEKMIGNTVILDYPSVGATENVMMAAVTAKGKTEIRNCAKEPEIVDLMRLLNLMGAKVYGAGTSTILIDGVEKLHGARFKPVFDRIEAGTFMIATAICGGEVQLRNCNLKNISVLAHKLCDNSCKIRQKNDIIYIQSGGIRKSFHFSTGPYPDFPTDLQAQASVMACVARGRSIITESVFENRFNHLNELKKMGADFFIKGRTAYIDGVERLSGARVVAKDLRGGAALVLAGLCADGQTVVEGVNHIKRGYYNFDEKLRSLGGDIKITERINEE